ncbi:hypothetical protein PT974_00021 [Cladobotryum mycophilum]|uniref:Uncharacterized protein n=1 Tax=Cladobotryum mycophilum TaxID=491253 RepID=A0ABR0T133_9HYPO
MTQPFLPFTKSSIDERTISAVSDVLRSGWLTAGPKVKDLETALSDFFGGRPVRTFNSGTSSLETALRIAGVGPGDEVITTSLSWVATAHVILAVGATPVFADIEWTTRHIDTNEVERVITPRTKAIIPVHLAGMPADMPRILDLARKHNLRVIEDAAQAIGTTFEGKRIGSFGDIVAFSFQATKNMTTGEGGCLVLNNENEAALAEKLHMQGITRNEYGEMEVDILGRKLNMNEIAAIIGLEQLRQLEAITRKRRTLAQFYFTGFGPDFEGRYGVKLPIAELENSNRHLFQIVLPVHFLRKDFCEKMQSLHQIGTGYHYPPIHLFKLYRERGYKEGMLPVTERIGRSIVTLPMFFSTMTEEDVKRVIDAVISVLELNGSTLVNN